MIIAPSKNRLKKPFSWLENKYLFMEKKDGDKHKLQHLKRFFYLKKNTGFFFKLIFFFWTKKNQ